MSVFPDGQRPEWHRRAQSKFHNAGQRYDSPQDIRQPDEAGNVDVCLQTLGTPASSEIAGYANR
jgi:hypothetical protein